jgi:hypothetical protein
VRYWSLEQEQEGIIFRSEKRSNKPIIRSEKWVKLQIFVQKNGLDGCFSFGKVYFCSEKLFEKC